MRFDRTFGPPPVPRQEVEAFVTERGQRFIATCLAHFDRGMNSAEIASATFEHEASVAWAIRVGREQRRDA